MMITTTRETDVQHPAEAPAVIDAQHELGEASAALTSAQRALTAAQHDHGSDDPVIRRLALLRLPALSDAVEQADILVEERRRAYHTARETARQQVAPLLRAKYDDAVRNFARALKQAAEANGILAAAQFAAYEALGPNNGFLPLAWPELFAETPSHSSKIAAWRRAALDHGIDLY